MYPGFFDELQKLAEEEVKHERLMNAVSSAKPWVTSAVKGAVPAALVSNIALPMMDSPLKKRIASGSALLGAAAGVGDLAMKRWAQKHPNHPTAEKIVSAQTPAEVPIRKVAAMAADLRRLGTAGVKRPAFPTEGSKDIANKAFNQASRIGSFVGRASPKNLVAPGPSVSQIAPRPR